MAQDTKKKSSTVALLAAFAVLLITILGFGWNVFLSAALAAASFFVVVQLGPKKEEEAVEPLRSATAHQVTPEAPQASEAAPVEDVTSGPSDDVKAQTVTPSMAGQVKLGTLLPGERELADRRGGWRYEG